jgi:hypothetical protein
VNWLFEAAKLIIPPVLAAVIGGYFVARRQARETQIEGRLDDLSKEVNEVANNASAYWRKPPTDPEVPLLADKVSAGLIRTDGLRAIVENRLSTSSKDEITQAASCFFRDTTGGDFGVHNRTEDTQRARAVILSAANYTVAVRRARMLDLAGWWRRR